MNEFKKLKDNYIIIVDYDDLAQIPRVRHLIKQARSLQGLATVLIRHKLQAIDQSLTPFLVEVPPGRPDFLKEVLRYLSVVPSFSLGVFCFSVRAENEASKLASRLGLEFYGALGAGNEGMGRPIDGARVTGPSGG